MIAVLCMTLNSNIRCIEITSLKSNYTMFVRWIVTLDVLKLQFLKPPFFKGKGWIVTLDVLKWWKAKTAYNRYDCWIVTLDVLKCVIINPLLYLI